MLSAVTMIFLKESPIARRERVSVCIRHPPCRLDIIALTPLIGNEIHFKRESYRFALIVFCAYRDVPDINEEITIAKFVVYDVLHDVVFFILPEGKDGIPEAQILEIVF